MTNETNETPAPDFDYSQKTDLPLFLTIGTADAWIIMRGDMQGDSPVSSGQFIHGVLSHVLENSADEDIVHDLVSRALHCGFRFAMGFVPGVELMIDFAKEPNDPRIAITVARTEAEVGTVEAKPIGTLIDLERWTESPADFKSSMYRDDGTERTGFLVRPILTPTLKAAKDALLEGLGIKVAKADPAPADPLPPAKPWTHWPTHEELRPAA